MKIRIKNAEKILEITVGILGITLIFLVSFILFKRIDKREKQTYNETIIDQNVVKEQEIDGFHFYSTALVIENGGSKLTTEVKNMTDQDIQLQSFDIIMKDKKGKIIATLLGYIGETIRSGETKSIHSSTDWDLRNAHSITYKINY